MIKKLSLMFLFGWATMTCSSQNVKQEIEFLKYLIDNKLRNEAITLIENLEDKSGFQSKLDTLNYFKGKTYFQLQKLELAAISFEDVTPKASSIWHESRFFGALSYTYSGVYSEASNMLDTEMNDEKFDGLKYFELAGISLLNRDLKSFESHQKNFNDNYFEYRKQQNQLVGYYQDIKAFKKKSPFLAGMFSAIIPGSGKMYAGKVGQGIAGLLSTSLFGLQAFEAYRKDGVNSARFIIFGGLFSAFYVANIWGSVFTVKLRRDEFNNAVNKAILVDLHIPLRTIFN